MNKSLFINTINIFKKTIILRSVYLIINSIGGIFLSIQLGNVMNKVLLQESISKMDLFVFSSLLIIMCLFTPMLFYFSNKSFLFNSIASEKTIFNSVLNQDPNKITNYDPETLAKQIFTDGIELRWSVIDCCCYFIEFIFLLLVLSYIILKKHIYIVLYILIVGLINHYIAKIIANKISAAKIKYLDSRNSIFAFLEKSILNRDFILINNLFNPLSLQFQKKINQYRKRYINPFYKLTNIQLLTNDLSNNLYYVGIILIGLYLYLQNIISLGEVLTLSYLYSIVSVQLSHWMDGMKSYKMIGLVSAKINEYAKNDEYEMKDIEFNQIKINKIDYWLKEFHLTKEFNITIHPGDKVAIIGKNGSGKTTLLNILMGIYKTEDQEIYLNGEIYDTQWIEANSTYIDSEGNLFNDIVNNYIYANIDRFVSIEKRFNVEELLSKKEGLSGGERKRVDFSRMIMEQRKILFIDEPENFLDHSNKEILIDYFKNSKQTIIYTTHDQQLINMANLKITL